MDEKIIRLAALQDRGELPPTAEVALAMVFAARYADKLRYVAKWGQWLIYDGTRWRSDETWHVFDMARGICCEVAIEAEAAAKTVASAKTVAAVERLAKADRRLAATVAQFDAEPLLLATHNGATCDLSCGEGRPPDALDYITKKTNCVTAPIGAPHPIWTAFLKRITADNQDLQDFLQRYVGYCCTGLTTEHVFVFGYGTGANGKGTFINTIADIFGDYATIADMGTFIASAGERHPTDLAKLNGARLVVAQETQKGRRWDETKIKALTGGDKMTARFMQQDFFDFDPTFKLFIAGNHKPRLSSVDEAIRRRLLLVPFTVQIPASERDPDLRNKLKPEWPAILRWCIDGCLEWQRIGLVPPAIVRDATDAYFADQDTLGQWLEDCTVVDASPFAFTRVAELFDSWKAWCETHNHKPGSTTSLSEMLTDRGFNKKREGAYARNSAAPHPKAAQHRRTNQRPPQGRGGSIGGGCMTADTPDAGTDLCAILAAAAGLPDYRRRTVEPLLTERLQAALTITAAAAELVAAWRSLVEQSRALDKIFETDGRSRPCLAEPNWRKVTETELWRLAGGYHDPSRDPELQFPCVCSGPADRRDLLVPLADMVRDANNRIRARLA